MLAPYILLFTILGKLMGDLKVHQYVDLLTLNEDLVGNLDEVLSKLEEFHNNSVIQELQPNLSALELIPENPGPFKINNYCANGKHNSKCTNHFEEECYAKNIHLQPARHDKRRRPFQSHNTYTHVSISKVLVTGIVSSLETQDLIIDCGDTHHIFKKKDLFLSIS
ncbi:hypothetical protein O181_055102 [Austropuccinia psidii MF-1]|uniref:Uncharacterized protein n=1 Tax=Austropuccinia psidii MF-1 TaxID=1389203 RepID=A0A9Q3ECZ4_9BASI|nr:hypothetical protein [Austropuccinia psidii MF-1]